jgi:hypothetical protein
MEKSAPSKIILEIDQEESFDYEIGKSHKYSLKDYHQMIFKEVINVQKERQEYILSLKNTN